MPRDAAISMACPQSAPPHPSSTSRPAPLGHGRSLPRSCASLHRRPACCAVQYEAPPLESAAEDIPLPMPSREIAHIHGGNLRCNEPVICSLLRPGRCPPPINPPIQLPVGPRHRLLRKRRSFRRRLSVPEERAVAVDLPAHLSAVDPSVYQALIAAAPSLSCSSPAAGSSVTLPAGALLAAIRLLSLLGTSPMLRPPVPLAVCRLRKHWQTDRTTPAERCRLLKNVACSARPLPRRPEW